MGTLVSPFARNVEDAGYVGACDKGFVSGVWISFSNGMSVVEVGFSEA